MIYLLEAVDIYNDTWLLTFYFVLSISIVIGTAWTCYQMFWKRDKKLLKTPLKENVIYNHSEDIIEYYEKYPKKREGQKPINNYKLRNFDTINEDIFDDSKEHMTTNNIIEEHQYVEIAKPSDDDYNDINQIEKENETSKTNDDYNIKKKSKSKNYYRYRDYKKNYYKNKKYYKKHQ